jgi:CO/xanthine dehydrogenase FAD-binding subunit
MRSYLPAYELAAPATLAEALALMAREPGVWRPFAGGTDLMVLFEAGQLEHKKFLSLWQLPELKGIEIGEEHVVLGGLTTYTEVVRSAVLQREFPMLCQAARETGGIANQNRGTLAGNIVNASPAADSPPALLAYDAELELASAEGARWIPYQGFTGVGGGRPLDSLPGLSHRLQEDDSAAGGSHPPHPPATELAVALALLPQSGHAARASDLQGLFCGNR